MPEKSARLSPTTTVLGVGLLLGLIHLNKPVHIDDTLYLTIARRILEQPLDPYGGQIVWQQILEPTYRVSISPPLLSYYFAAIMAFCGESVIALHAAMIPWILLAAWALEQLGQRWSGRGTLGALLVLCAPVFAVGINLMLDVPMLACVVASIELFWRGLHRHDRLRELLVAGLLAAVAVLIKYPAVALIPIMLVVAWQARRPAALLAPLLPTLAFIGWQALSRQLYGASQVGEGMGFLQQFRFDVFRLVLERALTMFALLAMTFPFWIAVIARTGVHRWSVLAGTVAATVALGLFAYYPQREPVVSIVFLLAVFVGAASVTAIVRIGWARADEPGGLDPRPLLLLWALGFSAVAVLFAPFVAVRSLLPVCPPLVFLFLRSQRDGSRSRIGGPIALVVSIVLTGLLAWTDYRWAACYPSAVKQIRAELGAQDQPIYFLGHWGWQYYAERAGFLAWDARTRQAPVDALIIVPRRADKQYLQPQVRAQLRPLRTIRVGAHPLRLTTWNRPAGLRFYGGDFGQLPWGFSAEPTEEIYCFSVAPVAFAGRTHPTL